MRAMAAVRGGVAVGALGATDHLMARVVALEWHQIEAPGPRRLDQAVTLTAALAALLVGAWLTATLVAVVLAQAPGRVGEAADWVAQRCAPALARRAAAAVLGVAVGASLAPSAALAAEGPPPAVRLTHPARPRDAVPVVAPPGWGLAPAPADSPSPASADAPSPASADPAGPGWTPTRPGQRAAATSRLVMPRAVRTGARTDTETIVVRRGDTLWDIARRFYGPGATDAEIAAAWPAWHEANRAVIGADPDLIRPGQVLHPPVGARPTAAG